MVFSTLLKAQADKYLIENLNYIKFQEVNLCLMLYCTEKFLLQMK